MIVEYKEQVHQQHLYQEIKKLVLQEYDFNQKFQVGISTEKYDLRLYDIQTFTEITVGTAITAAKDSYVKGKFSGSTGFLRACTI
ncbi:MAG: hypothetical protein CM15mV20_0810 [uncultured marine virus]|nr:MAG: hypothetical protein CM15mV20_0810 [uncultured marine virus]